MNVINSEADKLFKTFFSYAREKRDQGVNDFTEIVRGVYRQLLNEYDDGNSRNNLTKRFLGMMKSYVDTDPRYQMRIDEVLR